MNEEERFYRECAKKVDNTIDEAFDLCKDLADNNDLNLDWVLDYFVEHCRRRFNKNLKNL